MSAAGALHGCAGGQPVQPGVTNLPSAVAGGWQAKELALTGRMRKLSTMPNAMVRTGQRLDPSPAITDLKNSCYFQPFFNLLEKF